ncbi:MAG: helix-turn-helix domain-containing protein [Rickettsiella sp.]|nr:helix-turn-helix domain-containing protein [Rickettsiella sp.]
MPIGFYQKVITTKIKRADFVSVCLSKKVAAKRCGIPRSTLYRWLKRYKQKGVIGLQDISQKPHHFAKQKVTNQLRESMVKIREIYKFGPQRISTHLLREHKIEISAPTTWRILKGPSSKSVKALSWKTSY